MNYEREARADEINFHGKIDKELFGDIAQSWATEIANAGKIKENRGTNKYTKIRAFYDDIEKLYTKSLRWHDITSEEFEGSILPHLNMIKSKVSYAKARNLITDDFERFTRICISQVSKPQELETCKLFFESFIGFYRGQAPK